MTSCTRTFPLTGSTQRVALPGGSRLPYLLPATLRHAHLGRLCMHRAFRLIFVLLCAAMVSGVPGALAAQIATPASLPATPVASAAHGSLLAAMDPSVTPGQDFYRYATGRWQDTTMIPAD